MKTLKKLVLILLLFTSFFALLFLDNSTSSEKEILIKQPNNNATTSNSLVITDFSNFSISQNHPLISSVNQIENLNFSYLGESYEEFINEIYNLDFYSSWNITDFDVEFAVNFNYNDTQDKGNFSFLIWSSYNETEQMNSTLLGSISIIDNWNTSTGLLEIVGYPNMIFDKYNTSISSIPLSEMINFHANRTDNKFTLEIINSTTEEIIITHTWDDAIHNPVNMFQVDFGVGGRNNSLNINLTNFQTKINYKEPFVNPGYPFTIDFNDFSDFFISDNSSYIKSKNNDSHLDFTFDGEVYSGSYSERYNMLLDDYGNCSDFSITIDLDYRYDELVLGTLDIRLVSYYNEEREFVGSTEIGTPLDVCFASVYDPWASYGGTYRIGATPNDVWYTSRSAYGTSEKDGTVSFVISRLNGIISIDCIRNGTSYLLLQLLSQEVLKPVNFISIGTEIIASYNNFSKGVFSNISASLTFDNYDFPQSEPPVNGNEQNDGGFSGDAGETFDTARQIADDTFQGYLDTDDDDDFYIFYIFGYVTLTINMFGPESADFDLYLYNPNKNLIDQGLQSIANETVTSTVYSGGYWYINVHRFEGVGQYTISITTVDISSSTSNGDRNPTVLIALGVIAAVLLIILITFLIITKRKTSPNQSTETAGTEQTIDKSYLTDEEIRIAQRVQATKIPDEEEFYDEYKGYSFGMKDEENDEK